MRNWRSKVLQGFKIATRPSFILLFLVLLSVLTFGPSLETELDLRRL